MAVLRSFILQAMTAAAAGLWLCAPGAAQQQPDAPDPAGAQQPARIDTSRIQPVEQSRPLQIDPDALRAVPRNQFQAQDFTQLRPVIRDDAERNPRLAVVDWAAAIADRRAEQQEYGGGDPAAATTAAAAPRPYLPDMSERSRARLRPVHLPVLLPRRTEARQLTRAGGEPGMMMITRDYFYDASYHEDGLSVQISGNRLINHRGAEAARAAGLDRDRGVDGARMVRNESGLSLDFTRYGVAYSVTIECGSADDPRCRDETYMRDLVRRLVVAGGNPEQER